MSELAVCSCEEVAEEPEQPAEPPEGRYTTTNPPVRYDTTGALTPAAHGRRPVPLGHLVENADPNLPNPPVRYNTTGALSSCCAGEFPSAALPAAVALATGSPTTDAVLETSSSCSCCAEIEPLEPSEEGRYKTAHPPIRYDTTSALTAAAGGRRLVPLGSLIENADPSAPNPPVRYNTTGALSSYVQSRDVDVPPEGAIPSQEKDVEVAGEGYKETNPPIRYDTTGSLTAAAGGKRPVPLGSVVVKADPNAPNPPVRYNATGALSSCYQGGAVPAVAVATSSTLEPADSTCSCCAEEGPEEPEKPSEGGYKTNNPHVRYDTTGALTAAAHGRRPVPLGHLVENADPEAPNPPVRYNTTGALSSCATSVSPIVQMAPEEDAADISCTCVLVTA